MLQRTSPDGHQQLSSAAGLIGLYHLILIQQKQSLLESAEQQYSFPGLGQEKFLIELKMHTVHLKVEF